MPSDNHSLLKTIWCGGRLSYDVKFSHRALMNNGGLCRDEQWNSDFLLPMELMNMLIEIEKVGEQSCCWCCNIVSHIWWMFPGISSSRSQFFDNRS
ncbi:hypothetical protein SDJN03_25716, partial [Cucurbita argyrosperma subsp. sororia]